MNADQQAEALAFLERAQTYGPDVTVVERVDTHISAVFLAGERAYKLKRAVRFSYLDFSTLARREAACRAEVLLNRRTAPDLYLGVWTIARAPDGSCAFNGTGEVLDYVVVMHRFDQALLFDRLAERDALEAATMEDLSVEIARFHAAAEPTPGYGGHVSLDVEIAGNEENLGRAPARTFSPALCRSLVTRWRTLLARDAALLDRRDREGKVRRCHGDLHLRNICLWRGRPTLFDCIEFSEHLACIDVLYDLAFLLMDLTHRGLDAFANLVFNTYLDENDEADGVAALPLMMSLRAAIRAHTGLAAAHAQTHPKRAQAIVDESRAYLALAQRLLEGGPPRLIAVGGLSGTGKSTLARALAPISASAPGARMLHTDALRKALFGAPKTQRLPEAAYAPDVSTRVYERQRDEAARYLRAGYSVIVDGVFGVPQERAAIAAVAAACGVPLRGLWLEAPVDELRQRIDGRRADMSDATADVLALQLAHDVGPIDWQRIDAAGEPPTVAAAARAALAAPPQESLL